MNDPLPTDKMLIWARSIQAKWHWQVSADDLFQEGVCAWLAQSDTVPPRLRGSRAYWTMFRYAVIEVYGSYQVYDRLRKKAAYWQDKQLRVKYPQRKAPPYDRSREQESRNRSQASTPQGSNQTRRSLKKGAESDPNASNVESRE